MRSALSYRDLEEMVVERWLCIDHTTIFRWVQCSASELDKRCRAHLKAITDSWKVDETSINLKKVWIYLYQAIDSPGNTIEFFLRPTRDTEAATRFFCKALHVMVGSAPQVCSIEDQVAQSTTPNRPSSRHVSSSGDHCGQKCGLSSSHF